MSTTVDARYNRWLAQYDALGRPTGVMDPEGNTRRTFYDAVGNAVKMRLANGDEVAAEYDALNRQIRVVDTPAVTEVAYDAGGNRIWVRDAHGHYTRYEYDSLDRLVAVYDALNLDSEVSCSHRFWADSSVFRPTRAPSRIFGLIAEKGGLSSWECVAEIFPYD